MKILVKIPTRSRPTQFLDLLQNYINLSKDKSIQYLISIDQDDYSMNNKQVIESLTHPNIILNIGSSISKVHAYNRGIVDNFIWDILVVSSDDMVCIKEGWDEIIKQNMKHHFKDTDGVLWFNDGYVGNKLNTLPIIGRYYYERFGYVYHPTYASLFCDNEFMEIANKLGKQIYIEETLFRHDHYANNSKIKCDDLMKRNEGFYYRDKKNYESRKKINFGL